MDLSQYAELFLAESREHLSACNQLLLEWERNPAALQPVGGLFRAVHTIKGMAATMGYGRVADLAHRMENLLDQLRRGGKPPSDEIIQLLFRATDALEKSVTVAVAGRERDADLRVLGAAAIDEAVITTGEISVTGAPNPAGGAGGGARSRHIRVDLRRLDTLMDLIGELVTERGRLNDLAARWIGRGGDPEIDDVAI